MSRTHRRTTGKQISYGSKPVYDHCQGDWRIFLRRKVFYKSEVSSETWDRLLNQKKDLFHRDGWYSCNEPGPRWYKHEFTIAPDRRKVRDLLRKLHSLKDLEEHPIFPGRYYYPWYN